MALWPWYGIPDFIDSNSSFFLLRPLFQSFKRSILAFISTDKSILKRLKRKKKTIV